MIFVKFITSWSFRDLDAVVRSAAIPDATILGGGVLGSGLLSIVIRFLSLVQLPSLFHGDAELSCLGEHVRTAAASACGHHDSPATSCSGPENQGRHSPALRRGAKRLTTKSPNNSGQPESKQATGPPERETPATCAEGGWPSLFGMFRSMMVVRASRPAMSSPRSTMLLNLRNRGGSGQAALVRRPVTQYVGEREVTQCVGEEEEESPSVSGRV